VAASGTADRLIVRYSCACRPPRACPPAGIFAVSEAEAAAIRVVFKQRGSRLGTWTNLSPSMSYFTPLTRIPT
jgi:hypothetical protein